MFIQTMDNSVSILEFKLPNTWFSNYHVVKYQYSKYDILFKVLNTHEKSHQLNLKLGDKESDKRPMISNDTEAFDRNMRFLVDIDSELMGIPDIEYQANIFTIAKIFPLIDQMKLFGDTYPFVAVKKKWK